MRGLIQLFLCLASEDSATPSTDVDRETPSNRYIEYQDPA